MTVVSVGAPTPQSLGISLGGILGGIAGGIAGFVTGGPIGAIGGAIAGGGLGGGRQPGGIPGLGGPSRGPCCPPGSLCSGNCINTPIGSACVGGQGCIESARAPTGFGGPGTGAPAPVGQAPGANGACPDSNVCVTPGGQKGRTKCVVEKGLRFNKCVAVRRINPLNARAARRAASRLTGAKRELDKIMKLTEKAVGGRSRRRVPSRSRGKVACVCG